MQCSSYTGVMKGRDFHCKSCGNATEQPDIVDDTSEDAIIEQMKTEGETQAMAKPYCLQCSSREGTMQGKTFRCKSCGALTDQPKETWEKKAPPKEVNPSALTPEKELMGLLEAYDTGAAPFNMKSEALDLYKCLDTLYDDQLTEAAEEAGRAETAALEKAEDAAEKHLEERKQALIEAVTDACAPHLQGLGADIVMMIEEHIE
jgi:hypothetical protein